MKVGIVGFSRAGKTTLFNALTSLHAAVGSYGDQTRPNLGTIKVPDDRLDRLSAIFQPKKTTPAEIVFVDFPGPHEGSSKVLDQTTLVHMRDADALTQVVRAFHDPMTQESPDPGRDIDNFKSDLLLADLAIVERRLERLHKERGKETEIDLLERCRSALERETPLRQVNLSAVEEGALSGFGLLSRLPLLVVVNVDEQQLTVPLPDAIETRLTRDGVSGLALCAQIEMEIAALDGEDRDAFLADLGLQGSARNRFIRAAYALLELISFFTTGSDEVRAWPIRKDTSAAKAGGKVHTDMERGFIRAEVVPYEDFIRLGSEAKCREAGKLRIEGKEYVVQDGDITHFRFNV